MFTHFLGGTIVALPPTQLLQQGVGDVSLVAQDHGEGLEEEPAREVPHLGEREREREEGRKYMREREKGSRNWMKRKKAENEETKLEKIKGKRKQQKRDRTSCAGLKMQEGEQENHLMLVPSFRNEDGGCRSR